MPDVAWDSAKALFDTLTELLRRCRPFVEGDQSSFDTPEAVAAERESLLKAMRDYV